MTPSAFDYVRPATMAEALAALGPDARVLAGGQSLMAALNFRLDAPERLVDIGALPLGGIADGDPVRIGALARHREVERSAVIAARLPVIARAVREVAHAAIRNRGTFGGSVALADPAAEMPACCLALGATVVAEGPGGARRIAADDFFLGLYETALAEDEILTAIEIPALRPEDRWGFAELGRRQGDYAMAGVVVVRRDAWRVVLFGVSDRPVRAPAAEAALAEGREADPTEGLDIFGDLNAPEAMKRHLARVLLRRALA